MEKEILLDQLGYYAGDVKKAVIRRKDGAAFDSTEQKDLEFRVLCMECGKAVLNGTLTGPVTNESAGEVDYVADLSALKDEGTYQIELADGTRSGSFKVSEQVYDSLYEQTLRFFYLQRCGCKLPESLAGKYAHASCHDTKARIYGTDQFLEVSGGWHDAGDYGKYIVAAAMTVADLLLGYEKNQKKMGMRFDIPESSSALPDLLSEIKYELDWMLKMQDTATGQVYHKVTCTHFPGFVMPEFETDELVISPASITATASFAAALAMSARFYEDYNENFSRTLLQAAEKAYAALAGMHMPGGFKNPEGIVTGEYCDATDRDEIYWAAASLYHATGKVQYRTDFEKLAKEQIMHGYGWEDVGSFGNLAYLGTNHAKDASLVKEIQDSMVALADGYLKNVQSDSYETGIQDYIWGSNFYVAQIGNHLYDAYVITGRTEYLNAAKEQLHFLLGKNPNGCCYVTGFGWKSPMNPHHRPSAAAGSAMPGMLVGGTDSGLHDPDAVEHCTGAPAAKCYIDLLGSYSTNEVTIYWNSALLYLMAVIY